jgi:hypothetical protein
VHNGTVVTFTTTIGRIEPSEARTDNGQVRVRFFADGQSGTAVVTAFSGGASGKLENLKVGSAGAERILLSANPQALACSGGNSQVSARVEDVSGVGLPQVPVVFTTTKGQLNPSTATTDASGVANSTLSTSQEAIVTANAAGKTATALETLSPRTGVGITSPRATIAEERDQLHGSGCCHREHPQCRASILAMADLRNSVQSAVHERAAYCIREGT